MAAAEVHEKVIVQYFGNALKQPRINGFSRENGINVFPRFIDAFGEFGYRNSFGFQYFFDLFANVQVLRQQAIQIAPARNSSFLVESY